MSPDNNRVTARFKNVSHAIPEALGNKRVISLEECDDCNSSYSAYEGELAKMLTVERVFAAARGKRGGACTRPPGPWVTAVVSANSVE